MQNTTELLRLLSGLCDGNLTQSDEARLEALLDSEEARQVYLQYLDMHARLLSRPGASNMPALDGVAAAIGADSVDGRVLLATSLPEQSRRRSLSARLPWLPYALVAAATLAATILVQIALGPFHLPAPSAQVSSMSPVYVATLSQAVDPAWGKGTERYRSGARVLAGPFELSAGVARLSYDGGLELIVEGPAVLQLESESAATLHSGKVVFRADDASAPFTLTTPNSTLVDLGTEYAVAVGGSHEEVHVFSGEVQRLSKQAGPQTAPELLAAGEARQYDDASTSGKPTNAEPDKFVRYLPAGTSEDSDPGRGLLVYEGFDYSDAAALRGETARGGLGFAGPWSRGFARRPGEKLDNQFALNVQDGLVRRSAAAPSVGGAFEHVGFSKYFRRLTNPIRLDTDAVYYFSCLVRREGPPRDALNSVSLQLRESQELDSDLGGGEKDLHKRLNFGIDRTNDVFTHLERIGRRMPMPLSFGETYLIVAKVAASGVHPDQVFLRVYGPDEPVEAEETAHWSSVGPPVESDLALEWLEVHINSDTRQTIDEIRIGTTWGSVAAPWRAGKDQQL